MGCHKHVNFKNGKNQRFVNISFLSCLRSLDPRVSNEFPSCHVVNMTYEGLMHLDLNGEHTFGIAKSVDISEDQLTYIFHLRDSHWSNGDLLTAYDFEYSWKKTVDPQFAHTGSFTFYSIKNVSACLEGDVSVDEVGIHALDQKTLKVELEHPAPYFLYLTTCSTYSPIHRQMDEKLPNWANVSGDTFICNGPFKLKKWKKSVEIVLEKNEHYWDTKNVQLPGIQIQIIHDANTQYMLFEKGQLDWVGQPFNPLPFDIFEDDHIEDKVHKLEAMGLYWFFVNTEKPPFDNKNLRKAIAYAINRQEITDHIFQTGEVPAMGILNSKLRLKNTPYFEDGNIEKAQEHLRMALKDLGLKNVTELPPVTVSQRSSIFMLRVMQAIQQQIYEVLGIQIELEQSDWPVHFNKLAQGDFSIGEIGWSSWLWDPIYMLDTFRTRSFATNMSRWEDVRYKEYLEKSDYEIDIEKRKEYLQQAEQILMEEMPVIPICFNSIAFMNNPKLKNVYLSPLKVIDFRSSFFEE